MAAAKIMKTDDVSAIKHPGRKNKSKWKGQSRLGHALMMAREKERERERERERPRGKASIFKYPGGKNL